MRLNYKRLGDYIELCNSFNQGMEVKNLLGISNNKYFQDSHTNTIGIDLQSYRVVRNGEFAYNRATTRNGDKISIALRQGEDCIVSPSYRIFKSSDEEKLLSEYLMMWFRRAEFDRYARFKSHGSAHEFFEWEQMCEVELPIPNPDKQKEIVNEYNTILDRINLNNQLIQKLEETTQIIYKQSFVNEINIESLPEGWSITSLSSVCESIVAGTIPEYQLEGPDLVLGQRCVHDNCVDLNFARFHKPKPSYTPLNFGDILINSTGSGTLGRVGQIFFQPNRLSFDSNMTLIRAAKDYYVDYIGCILSEKEDYFIQISQGSTNQTRLYCSMISPLQIVNPPEDVLVSFTNKVRQLNVLKQHYRDENSLLKKLENLLLSKLATIES